MENGFCSALAAEYKDGACSSCHLVQILNLRDLELDKYLHYVHEKRYEPLVVVLKAQELFSWSDHLVFVYPIWRDGLPALLRRN